MTTIFFDMTLISARQKTHVDPVKEATHHQTQNLWASSSTTCFPRMDTYEIKEGSKRVEETTYCTEANCTTCQCQAHCSSSEVLCICSEEITTCIHSRGSNCYPRNTTAFFAEETAPGEDHRGRLFGREDPFMCQSPCDTSYCSKSLRTGFSGIRTGDL